MTLTTEQLRERISHLKERLRDMKQHKYPDNCPNAAAYLESLKGELQQDIELLEELLANREAPPASAMPEEKPELGYNPSMSWGDQCVANAEIRGWNACRAAMLGGEK